jgi:suppressor of G2 allele of SKP1
VRANASGTVFRDQFGMEPISESSTSTSTSTAAAASAAPPSSSSRKPRFEHYQTQSSVTLTLFARDADATKSTVEVGERHVSVALALPSAGTFVLDLDLFDAVVPGAVQASYRPAKVELKLTKSPAAQYMWPVLEAGAAGSAAAPPPEAVRAKVAPVAAAAAAAAAPATASTSSSSSAGGAGGAGAGAAGASSSSSSSSATTTTTTRKTKDWAALERELAEEEAAAKPEGEEALQALFRQIYKNGDEDTRRAMIKSFQTSGGTVLSTNWNEVGKKDYEKEGIQPPEGMEVRKWEQ